MIDFKHSPVNVIAVSLGGEFSAEDVPALRDAFKAKLATHARLGVVVDFSDFSDATEEAIRKEIKFEMGLLNQIDRFAKVAIVSNKKWIQFLAEQAGKMMPGIEVRVFMSGNTADATAWAAEIADNRKHGPAFQRIKTSPQNTYAFELNGTLSALEMPSMIKDVDAFLQNHDKVRMLAKIGKVGFDPAVLLQKGLFTMKLAALNKVERYAIVGGPSWLQTTAQTMGPMTPGIELKTFSDADEGEAWNWIGASAV